MPAAYKDLQKAGSWYNEQSPGLGQDLRAEVNKEIASIKENPEHYQCKYNDIRKGLLNKSPYAIYYYIEHQKLQIIIFGILHTKRNPKIIKKRMS